jgi:hypothetical protein
MTDGPAAGLSPVADRGLGADLALTALVKCMTGG